MAKQWYVLRVASNKEDRVREALERKVKIEGLGEVVGKILVPTERISRVRAGVKRIAERKLYPGYVFIEMEMEENGSIPEQAWFLIKETSGVGDFIGADGKPVPMKAIDVEKMLAEAEKGSGEQVSFKIEFNPGETVKIKEGPFEGFEGHVDQVLPDKGLIRVVVTIFGRATPVEVEYWQVEKV
ncbi:MAG: transcription termination/antitermination protein NusG [Phycisphaerae bacterium]|nr:transcription termination/antitermination protein NusG [Phycisphaerae bacterium]